MLEKDGIYGIKLKQLRLQLLKMLPENLVVSEPSLGRILRTKFKLKFKKLEKANVKYSDPSYNEKRLWVSKLLAQFLAEEFVIISVDESNFRSDVIMNK